MNITILKNSKIVNKVPISKREDKKFIFKTINVNLENVFELNKQYFILNSELKEETEFIDFRRKTNLEKRLKEVQTFFILDLDKVTDENKIIETLKLKNYNFILYYSLSGKNLKGLVEVNSYNQLKAYYHFDELLKKYCEVDKSVLNIAGIQAPNKNSKIVYKNFGGVIPFFEKSKVEVKNLKIEFNQELYNICLDIIFSKGFSICKETEEIITLKKDDEKTKCGYFIFKNSLPIFVNHFNKEKSFSIFEEIKNIPKIKKHLLNLKFDIIKQKLFLDREKIFFNKKYISEDKIFENFNIKNNECVFIKSPMGTGKSHFITKLKNEKILLITNRKSLANEYKSKFEDFKLYSDFDYEDGDSLICQYESLHRFDISKFTLIVIDEFVSILEHSLSNLTDNYNYNNIKFYSILKKIKTKLLIMDTFLTGFEKEFVKRENYRFYENKFREDIELFKINNIELFYEKIINFAKENKITISVTNKKEGKFIKYMLEKNNIKTFLITGDNNNYLKFPKLFLENDFWQVLIYTPTITVGVNILAKAKYHFHYSDDTIPLISSIQQIKRNRESQKIFFYLKHKNVIKNIDLNSLEYEYFENFKKYNKIQYLEIDDFGNPYFLNDLGKFLIKKIYFSNLLNINQGMLFKHFLKFQFKNEIVEINDKSKLELSELKSDFNNYLKNKENELLKEIEDYSKLELEININSENLKEFKNIYNLNDKDLKELIKEIKKNKTFKRKLFFLKMYMFEKEKIKKIIDINIEKKLNLNYIKNLELLNEVDLKLKDIMEVKNEKEKTVLKLLGYKKHYNNIYKIDKKIFYFFKKLV